MALPMELADRGRRVFCHRRRVRPFFRTGAVDVPHVRRGQRRQGALCRHVPSIVVLHTVLAHPTPRQRIILDEVIAAASVVVTMTHTARSRLLDIYGTAPEKVVVIPHGAADNRVTASSAGTGPPMVLTWGLLGPGKGIEHAIDSMALLRERGLHVDYQVAGQTHPRVLARDGEAYRRALVARAQARNVEDRVHFDGRFLPMRPWAS